MSESIEVKGKVEFVSETDQVTDTFKKRVIVIEVSNDRSDYTEMIPIEFKQDKCTLLDSVAVGTEVTIHVNLRGRKWTSPTGEVKYFGNNEGWRIELPYKESAPVPVAPVQAPVKAAQPAQLVNAPQPQEQAPDIQEEVPF